MSEPVPMSVRVIDPVAGDVWVAVHLSVAWIAAVRLINPDTNPAIGEIHIYAAAAMPDDLRDQPIRSVKIDQLIPEDGIPMRLLKNLRATEILTRAMQLVAEDLLDDRWPSREPVGPAMLLARSFAAAGSRPAHRGGRRAYPARDLVIVAALYVDAVRAERRDAVVAVTEALALASKAPTREWVEDLVDRARSRGFLTSEGSGKAGGHLTELVLPVLDAHPDVRESLEKMGLDALLGYESSRGQVAQAGTTAARRTTRRGSTRPRG